MSAQITTIPDTATGTDPHAQAAALSERMFEGVLAAMELSTVHLGLELGLYAALREHGPARAAELAECTGHDERYLREWLEQQAVAQLVTCHDDLAQPEERLYALPDATAAVLLDEDDPTFLGPLAGMAIGTVHTVPDVVEAYRTGGGVPFARYGREVRHGLGRLNGATFDRSLVDWVRAMPDVDARLRDADRPRILDLGCGTGRSALALARAYPRAVVHGVDLDPTSVAEGRDAAAAAGLADRVRFVVGDAARIPLGEGYDLVTILEALHDMGDPVGALAAARAALRDGGAVLVADQLTREEFAADGDPIERFQYVCSVLHCLPATRAEEHVVAHGTVIRAATVEAWAREAGFTGVEVLDIEDPFWRFYRL